MSFNWKKALASVGGFTAGTFFTTLQATGSVKAAGIAAGSAAISAAVNFVLNPNKAEQAQ